MWIEFEFVENLARPGEKKTNESKREKIHFQSTSPVQRPPTSWALSFDLHQFCIQIDPAKGQQLGSFSLCWIFHSAHLEPPYQEVIVAKCKPPFSRIIVLLKMKFSLELLLFALCHTALVLNKQRLSNLIVCT